MLKKIIPIRKRDLLIIKIADWSKDKDEPAIDLEVYKNGKFDSKLSAVYGIGNEYGYQSPTKRLALTAATNKAERILHSYKLLTNE